MSDHIKEVKDALKDVAEVVPVNLSRFKCPKHQGRYDANCPECHRRFLAFMEDRNVNVVRP